MVRPGGAVGSVVTELERLPPELPAVCTSRIDECGDSISARGINRVAGLFGPNGESRLVIAVPNCPAAIVADPESLCSQGVDFSADLAVGDEVHDLESLGRAVWISTEGAAFRLDWSD